MTFGEQKKNYLNYWKINLKKIKNKKEVIFYILALFFPILANI